MGLAVIAGAVGDLYLTKGMKAIGDASFLNLKTFLPFFKSVFTSPQIWLGIGLVSVFFFLWLAVLSWEDLSIALPLQAPLFILGPLLAQNFLGESTNTMRWTGTILITIGVVLVTWGGPAKATQQKAGSSIVETK